MLHTFVFSDENIVNMYGYRVMTSGIDTSQYVKNAIVLYKHQRYDAKDVIGRATNVRKENGQLVADVEIDVEDEYAKTINGKIERGYIKMGSIFAMPVEESVEEDNLLPGQKYATVTKSKLIELSIVDIGGNDNALKLSAAHPDNLKLEAIHSNQENMKDLKTIALSLDMGTDATEDAVVKKIKDIQLNADNLKQERDQLKADLEKVRSTEINKIVDEAVELSLIPEVLKESQKKALEGDFENQSKVMLSLIEKARKNKTDAKKQGLVTDFVEGQAGASNDDKLSFDYLQKHDPAKLKEIKENTPEQYNKLAAEYARGKRYTKN